MHCIVTSPPYWPAKRAWSGPIGFESTLDEWIANVVSILRECHRVLRNDGTCFINIGDAYSKGGGKWWGDPMQPISKGVWHPDTRHVAPLGNLLLIPWRLAMALQADGWILRSAIIWRKIGQRPESMPNRPTTDYEVVLMLTKQATHYYFDQDVIRIPSQPASHYPEFGRGAQFGGHKPADTIRRDRNRGRQRFYPNPIGRNRGCVWDLPTASSYRGEHSATMPVELAELCIIAGCPEDGTVLDPFGGAGTTALAALRLNRKAISIEIDPAYTAEARTRIAKAMGLSVDRGDGATKNRQFDSAG